MDDSPILKTGGEGGRDKAKKGKAPQQNRYYLILDAGLSDRFTGWMFRCGVRVQSDRRRSAWRLRSKPPSPRQQSRADSHLQGRPPRMLGVGSGSRPAPVPTPRVSVLSPFSAPQRRDVRKTPCWLSSEAMKLTRLLRLILHSCCNIANKP